MSQGGYPGVPLYKIVQYIYIFIKKNKVTIFIYTLMFSITFLNIVYIQ